MSAISITKALRVPKVSQQYVNNVYSERFQDPRFNVCPVWNGQDNLGREVGYYTFNNLTNGCNDPMQRIEIENNLRPNYHPYLNTEGIDAEDQQYSSSFGGRYDTAGIRRDEAYRMNAEYGNVGAEKPLGSTRTLMGQAINSDEERIRFRRAMQRTNEANRYASGTSAYKTVSRGTGMYA